MLPPASASRARVGRGPMPITLSTARVKPTSALAFERSVAAMTLPGEEGTATLTDHLQKIANYGARQHFDRNELIFNQGDLAQSVYKIISGTVRLCRYAPDGRRAIVDFLAAGELLGLVENPSQPVTAEAVTDVTLISYPRLCFERLAVENSAVRTQLLHHFSHPLDTAQQHLMVLGCQKAKERLASFFVRLAEQMYVGSGDGLALSSG